MILTYLLTYLLTVFILCMRDLNVFPVHFGSTQTFFHERE